MEKEYHADNWSFYNGDCVEIVSQLPDKSVDYSIFSPPFANMFVYSDSLEDMGNCKDMDDFINHFRFLVIQLKRVIKDGRNVSVHCMNLPIKKGVEGYIGLRDFRGEIIKLFMECGFIYHSEVCIWKDPLLQAVRTKTLGLSHKQLCKDSTLSQQGLPDYVITFRNTGENLIPISKPAGFEGVAYPGKYNEELMKSGNYSHNFWRKIASPVWGDIRQTRTLNYKHARSENDERHICPLQTDVIDRCVMLWSNPDDVVLTPFGGIGSEVHQSLLLGRKAIGVELKENYYNAAIENCNSIPNSLDEFF
jgi:hypothetical protein